ncbi:putative WRKY transcription factor 70 [Citrus sinensis]|nr:putative WRKY transcription factor 70 [Citrus sinensis]
MEAGQATSSSSWLENSSDRRRAIEELIKGQEMALQLRNLIHKSTKSGEGSKAMIINQDLVANILSSFTNSLSILKNGDSDEASQVQEHTQLSSPCWEAYLKTEDSGESSKSSTVKDRRGCYKRRKCAESWTEHSSTLTDDGHAWRKYGQKVILNARFPRNYFRCTHKFDQGCQASKQVQRIQEEPPLHRTTYYGRHTCKSLIKSSQLMLDSTTSDQCPMISFGSAHITEKDFNPFLSSFPSIKQESNKDDQGPLSDMTHNQSSSSDEYLVSHDFPAFESNEHMKVLSSDHGDVISGVNSSCTASAHSLDLAVDMSVNFDDVLEFNF